MTSRSPFAPFLGAIAVAALAVPSAAFESEGPSYDERYRPRYHFSPPRHFLGDPCGLVFHRGRYHLFYQHNPEESRWGKLVWGHAVSGDLVHWTHRPPAIRDEAGAMVFSGSAVVDHRNSSGLGQDWTPPLLAIFTGSGRGRQTQNLASSTDDGATWVRYDRNPVLDLGVAEFRDPKVFWHDQTRRWVMVTALPSERKVRFDGSDDLRTWEELGEFGPAGAREGAWESPELFPLTVENDLADDRWLLKVDVNGGAPAGGSGSQYFLGRFNGSTFVNQSPPAKPLWVDHGKDFYAARSWSDIPALDGRRIWVGWMNNWQYANDLPTDPWRGMLSIPRVLSLRRVADGRVVLAQQPIEELKSLRGGSTRVVDRDLFDGETALEGVGLSGEALELELELEARDAREFGLKVHTGSNGEETVVGYNTVTGTLYVDRTRSGQVAFRRTFAGRHSAPLELDEGRLRLRVFVDASSIEVFAADGTIVLSDLIFPRPESRGVALFSRGGIARVVELQGWEMASIWERP